MSQVRVHSFAVSLDGFGTGEGQSLDAPFGHAGGLDIRIGRGPSTVRQFLAADLIDLMHVAVVPVVLGRGERVWDGLEGLERRFDVESVSSPSGVTHLTFTRR
jgi:dihydrofolate reductase